MKYILISVLFLCSACTYSISQIHTEGTASDVLDENDTPTLSVPVSVVPK